MISWSFALELVDRLRGAHAARVPLLVVDLYWKDLLGRPNWRALAGAPGYHGAVLKATEGTSYFRDAVDWFAWGWRSLRELASDRLGVDFLVGAYHYLRLDQDGARQAEYYLRTVERSGGFAAPGVMMPIVDVEAPRGSANARATRWELIDCARAFTAKVKSETGRDVILYGGAALAELGVRDHLGCRRLWPAAYTRSLSRREWTSIGWELEDVCLWQYTDGKTCKAVTTRGRVLPRVVPGFGAVDCSVFVGGASLTDFLRVLCGPQ